MQEQFNEQDTASKETQDDSGYAYKNVIKKDKTNRRTWSVVSLLFAVVSLLTFYFSWISLALGIVAVALGIISRKNLGYFDRIAIAGIIIGIFGIVFSVAGLIFGDILFSVF